jgi:hypothetical protein
MVSILPAAPHGTTDQMSPDHAAVPSLGHPDWRVVAPLGERN